MSEESTTPDLVRLMRQGREALSRGDLDAAMSFVAPDAVYDLSEGGLGSFEGEEAIRRFLEDWHRSWEDYRFEEEEILDLGNGVWLTVIRESGRLVGGKGRVEQRVAQVGIWANGKLEWLKAYPDPDEARAAAERLAEERGKAMPPENVEELTRWGYDWFNREKEPPPTWLPDGEFVNSREDPDHATYRGIDAIRKQHEGWFDAYPDLHVEPLEIRSNGDRVFVWTRFTGHGAESGAAMEMELAHVFTLEEGRTRRLEEYLDRTEALAAVGLADQAMSQENVDVVRGFYEAFARGEFPTAMIDPEVEYINPEGAVEPGIRRGISAFRRAVEKVFEGWETWQMEPDQYTPMRDQVAVVVRYRARGRTSGVELEGCESARFTLRDGKVVRYEWFHDPGDALRAADSEQ